MTNSNIQRVNNQKRNRSIQMVWKCCHRQYYMILNVIRCNTYTNTNRTLLMSIECHFASVWVILILKFGNFHFNDGLSTSIGGKPLNGIQRNSENHKIESPKWVIKNNCFFLLVKSGRFEENIWKKNLLSQSGKFQIFCANFLSVFVKWTNIIANNLIIFYSFVFFL